MNSARLLTRDGPVAVAFVDLARFGVRYDDRPRPDHAIAADFHAVADTTVDAEEAAFADLAVTGDHDVRGDEAMVADDSPVADVVAAPKHAVVADRGTILDDVVFEDEAVVADCGVPPDEGAGTDVGRRRVALLLRRLDTGGLGRGLTACR